MSEEAAATTEAPAEAAPAPEEQPPATEAPAILNDDGTFGQGYLDQFPSEQLGIFNKYGNDPVKVGQALVSSQQLIGRKLGIPAPGADEATVAAFREQNGIPQSPEGYNFSPPDNLPEGVEWDQETLTGKYAPVFHEIGLAPWQAERLIQANLAVEGERAAAMAASAESVQAAQIKAQDEILTAAFGAEKDAKIASAQRVALTAGVDMDDPEIGNNAKVIQAFAKIGALIGEDELVAATVAQTSHSYAAQAKDIMTNPNNPENAAYARGEADVVAKVRQLNKRAEAQRAKL